MEFASTSPLNPSSLAAYSSSVGLGEGVGLPGSPLQAGSGISPWVSAATSLVFVDRGVQDYQSLLGSIDQRTQVYVLDPTQDAIVQITNALLQHSGIESVHILSHGRAGALQLGDQWLGVEQLASYTTQLKSWSQALATNADVLLYGCEVAEGAIGQTFVHTLSQLTQADVAASTNLTGAGGDWSLEVETGHISATLLGNAAYQASLGPTQLLSPALTSLASATAGGSIGPGMVSDDGRYVVFTSRADNIVAGDLNGAEDVFLYDRQAGTYTLVSRNAARTGSGNGISNTAVISGDGNYVAFVSNASDLVGGSITDNNSNDDIFLWERSTGNITLLSAVGSQSANGPSGSPVISQDGSVVAFTSGAQNLLGGVADLNGAAQDLFVWTRASGTATLVSLNLNFNGTGNRGSGNQVVSQDGQYIAFVSTASNLTSNDTTFGADVFVYGVNTGTLDLVSVGPTGFSVPGTSVSGTPSMSADGRRIAFSTTASLTANDTNGQSDVYLWQRDAGGTVTLNLQSVNLSGQAGSGFSDSPVLSANGLAIAFSSVAGDLVAGDTNTSRDVFWRDLSTSPAGTGTRLISRNGTTIGDGNSSSPVISLDGQTVAFASLATNLVANDTNAKSDAFVYSVAADTLTLVSRQQGVTPAAVGNGDVLRPALSGNGQWVFLSTDASNLVPQDTNGVADVFSFEVASQTLALVSRRDPNLNSVTGNGNSIVTTGNNAVSADGRYVVFTSAVENLVPGDSNGKTDIFLRDTSLPNGDPNSLRLISRVSGGSTSGNDSSFAPVISADGNFIAFASFSSDLVAGDSNNQPDIFLYNRLTDTLTLVSRPSTGVSNGASDSPSITANGGAIVFTSTATNLIAGGSDSNNATDVFLWTAANGLRLVSRSSTNANQAGNGSSSAPVISSNGRYVVFVSNASDLVAGDTNGVADVFAFDTQTGQVTLLSTGSNGIANAASFNPVISDDGRYVAFVSNASNLVNGDGNGTSDVFRYDLQAASNPLSLVSVNLGGNPGITTGSPIGAGSSSPSMSADGRYIAFVSTASDLTATTDANGNVADVFVRDMQTGQTTLISVNAAGTASGNAIGQGSINPVITADGLFVAFTSTASNLVASDSNGIVQDVFVRDWQTAGGKTRLVSLNDAGTTAGNGASLAPALSRSGVYIAFTSDASNLVANDFNRSSDVFGQSLKPLVSLTVPDNQAAEGNTNQGRYQLSRDDVSAALTIKLAPQATSTASLADYTLTSSDAGVTVTRDAGTGVITVTLAAGVATANLNLVAVDDVSAEPDETVILTIAPDAAYGISGTANTGTVTILANDTGVINTNDSGEGSLRQAILNANAFAGQDTITFQIPGSGSQTIALQSVLPTLTDSVIIDGRTQTGFTNTPLIVLNGSAIAAQANGLSLLSNGSAIKGLAITGFSGNGISIAGNNNTIGLSGSETDSAVVISGNGQAGVYVESGTGNRISGNSIANNAALGIDLAPTGVTANDLDDADTGPNNLQNFPVLSFAEPIAGGNATIVGQLNAAAGQTFRVEFFSSPTADGSGNGEGQTYLGFQTVTTDAAGVAQIQFTTTSAVTGVVSATAIDANGNTSEFAAAVPIAPPSLSIAPVNLQQAEGNTGNTDYAFTITLSYASTQPVTVSYATQDGTATIANNDYGNTTGTLTFAPGETTKTIVVPIVGDDVQEPNETFTLALSNPTNAILGSTATATGTIRNDDGPVASLGSTPIAQVEGNSGTITYSFTVTLSQVPLTPLTLDYTTVNGTATTADNDFVTASGTLTFNPGETTKTITVTVNGDTKFEADETFQLVLSNPSEGLTLGTDTQTAIIQNDDTAPTLSIAPTSTNLPEGNSGTTTNTFTVSLSQASGQAVTVNYATADGTATTVDNDYVPASSTLTFAPGETSKIITVSINGDTVNEANETYQVVLSNPTGATLGTTTSATGTIVNDDATPTLTLTPATLSQPEGNTGTTAYTYTVNLSQASGQVVTVNYATADGTATTADNDYAATSGTLTFNPGETSKTITVNVNGDTKNEADETFNLTLSAPTNAALGTTSTATSTIVNDDAGPTVSFANASVSQAEGNTGTTTYTYTVNLSQASGQVVTVNYATADGTATTADNDYAATSGTLTFNPGETSKTITVNVNGDTKNEADEIFNLTLSAPTNAALGTTTTATGTITNDDLGPTLSIVPVNLTQPEGNSGTTPYTFTVSLSQASGLPVTVDYATSDGTATAGSDYALTSGKLSFAPGETSKTITVDLNGDTVYETNETFQVLLTNPTGATLATASATGTIANDDPLPTLNFAAANLTQAEGNSGTIAYTFTVNLSEAAGAPVTVNYTTQDGTATIADGDYATASGTLTFNPGETSKTITVNVNGDTTNEADETFSLVLSAPTNAALGTVTTVTGTITNDDATPTLTLTPATLSQPEGNAGTTAYTYTVNLSQASGQVVTVNYATADGTATTADNDYAATSGTLTFNPGETSKTITVNVNGDTKNEADETFNLTLSAPTNAALGSTTTATGTIVNDDAVPTVSIAPTTVSQPEGNSGTTANTFTVSFSQASGQTVTVNYATQDGTATTADNDYASATGTLTFAPGETSKTITVNVNGDTRNEANETYTVALTSPTGATLGANTSAIGIIQNDDAEPTLSIGPVNVSQPEGNSGTTAYTFTVSLSQASGLPVSVNYATVDGTATTADGDYAATNGTLTFNPGETSKTVTVNVNGDTKNELDETFQVVLSSAVGATLGTSASATGTIVNDDLLPTVTIVPTDANQAEGNSGTKAYTFTVNLSQASGQTVTVNYATQNGTATTADGDYAAASGTLTFNPGETSKIITVNVNGDTKNELDETFGVVLSSPAGATLGTTTTANGTIVNDDPLPTVTITPTNANQSEGNSGTTANTFTVNLSQASGQVVTVNYSTQDGTATTADGDYASTSGTLTFNPGETSKVITVNVNGDTKNELDETFGLALSAPSNATLGTTSTANATIVNDDLPPTVTIVPVNVSQPEGNSGTSAYTFRVDLSQASGLPVTVNYATQNGTATTADNDYAATNGTLTFAPGETSKTITVNVNGDSKVENDETFQVQLSNPSGATLGTAAIATGTIANDDLPVISLGSTTINQVEGDSGTKTYVFTVTLSQPSPQPVTVGYTTQDGTATVADSDYALTSGTLTFAPGETSKTITVTANGDTKVEGNETFQLVLTNTNLTGGILGTASQTGQIDNDDLPIVSITPANANQPEGNTGTTPFTFTVRLSQTPVAPVTVNYTTIDGTATTADNDYVTQTASLTFNPGETSKTITILGIGDTKPESDETFSVRISGPTNAILSATETTATATIRDDDPLKVSVAPDGNVDLLWRNTGTGDIAFWQMNQTPSASQYTLPVMTDRAWQVQGNGDFDGDGDSDVLWRNNRTGENVIWRMNGPTFGESLGLLTVPDQSWRVVGVGDFTGDRKLDILWQRNSGEVGIWMLDGGALVRSFLVYNVGSSDWFAEGVADFTGDQIADVVWRNQKTGAMGLWQMAADGGTPRLAQSINLPTVADLAWKVSGLADFTGDRRTDILWRNYRTGENVIWRLNDGQYAGNLSLIGVGEASWEIRGVADLNQDGSMDVVWRNKTTQQNVVWYLNNGAYGVGIYLPSSPANWSIAAVGNFGSDSTPDLFWVNDVTGETYTWTLDPSTFGRPVLLGRVGNGWSVELTGDFNGDGSVDLFWRNQSNGVNSIWLMRNGQLVSDANNLPQVGDLSWKIQGTADFDRDGKLDILWQNRATGQVAIWKMNGPDYAASIWLPQVSDLSWQVEGLADFDRDGSVDILWRNYRTGENVVWKMNGTAYQQGSFLLTVPNTSWQIEGIADFNQDGRPDLLWLNSATREVSIWTMSNFSILQSSRVGSTPSGTWQIRAVRDFNGEGYPDIFWVSPSTGATQLWYLNGVAFGAAVSLPTYSDLNWQVEGINDFGVA